VAAGLDAGEPGPAGTAPPVADALIIVMITMSCASE
jgi:hypothetical protein